MVNNIYYLIFGLILFFILRGYDEHFRTRILLLNKNKKILKEYVYFQHNKLIVSKESYAYCREYKRQLLYNITNLLNKLNVRFVISHGNLLEHTRNKPIYHDDDLDIRIYHKDFAKWVRYCMFLNALNLQSDKNFNLAFDGRIFKIDSQIKNGLQVRLIKMKNKNKLKEFKMDIHCDLVLNTIKSDVWCTYDIDWNNIIKTEYLGVKTFAPNIEDTHRILTKEYGYSYLKENYKSYDVDKQNKHLKI